MHFEYPFGATPLDPDEIIGLIPDNISTQNELNEFEQNNILQAETWIFSKNYSYLKILAIDFIQKIHFKMFNDTWRWAGKFRQTEKNIGVPPYFITTELKKLTDDIIYQIEHKVYHLDEISYRFHHRLVKTHPFPNGNGRHARLITDTLLIAMKQTPFSWGLKTKLGRKEYINALKQADQGSYELLALFVRS